MKAIVFDFDGVIHDTFDLAYSLTKSVCKRDINADEYRDFFNGNLFKNKDLLLTHKLFYKKQKEKFKTLIIDNEIKKILLRLKKKYALHIITSNTEESLNIYMKNNGLEDVFTSILGFETHTSKIKKFEMLFDLGLSKEDIIFITDTLGDILEANKLNIKTIAVDFGFHDRKRLERGNPHMIISNFKDIESLFE